MNKKWDLLKGFFGIILFNVLVVLCMNYLGTFAGHPLSSAVISLVGTFLIGLIQIPYVLVAVIILAIKGKRDLLRGVLLGAGLSLVLPLLLCH